MALVNAPISGGTLVSTNTTVDGFNSLQLSDTLYFAVSRQTGPNSVFMYLVNRDTTTGSLQYGPALNYSIANTITSTRVSKAVLIQISNTEILYIPEISGSTSSLSMALVTFDVASKRVTAVGALTSYSLGSTVFDFNKNTVRVSGQTPDKMNSVVINCNKIDDAYSTGQFVVVSKVGSTITASASPYSGGNIASGYNQMGVWQMTTPDRLVQRGYHTGGAASWFYRHATTGIWQQYQSLNGTSVANPGGGAFGNAGTYNVIFNDYLDTGFIVMSTDDNRMQFKNNSAGSFAIVAANSSTGGAIQPFTNYTDFTWTQTNGFFFTKILNASAFMVAYFEFNMNVYQTYAALSGLQPTKLHLRWYTRTTNTNDWTVNARDAGAYGYTINIPTNSAWGRIKQGANGIRLNDDFTFTLSYENPTTAGIGGYDNYTQIIGDTTGVTFPSASLAGFTSSAATNATVAATVASGSIQKYEIIGGSLPNGLALNATSGAITGTASSSAVDSKFTVRATTSSGTLAHRTFAWPKIIAPSELFAATAYTGSLTARTINTGVDLKNNGGMLWLKNRNVATSGQIYDSARSINQVLNPAGTNAQETITSGNRPNSFETTGFSLRADDYMNNDPSRNTIAWSFRRSKNFFDVVTYTGNGTSGRAVPHGLTSTPGMIIVRRLDVGDHWAVQHVATGAEQMGSLNQNAAFRSVNAFWASKQPTAAEFYVGTASETNASGGQYVAYVFGHDTSANGVIQCGQYYGTGGTYNVSLGWQPRFVMIKAFSALGNWVMFDTTRGITNGVDAMLSANLTDAENNSQTYLRVQSSGFVSDGGNNDSGQSGIGYIYMAIR